MLTDRGWAAMGASLALLLLWLALGEPELLGAGMLLAVGAASALIFVRSSRPRVSVTRRLKPGLAHEGDQATVEVTIDNHGRRSVRRPTLEDDVTGLGSARFVSARLLPGERAVASYHILCKPRGVYRVGPARVTVSDPLQLAVSGGLTGDGDRLIVYPQVEDLVGFPAVRGLDPSQQAAQPEFTHSGGEDFFTLREYQNGDDLRRVHWPSSAKRDQLMIRQLETPWQSRGLVLVDTRRLSYESTEAFEKAVKGAASIVRHLMRSGFDAELVAGQVVPASSREHDPYAQAMETLALVQPEDAVDIRAVAARVQRRGRGGALVLVTGIPDGELVATRQLLSRDYRTTILLSVAAADPAAVLQFQRSGAITVTVDSGGSWAREWRKAVEKTWHTATAG